MFFSIVPNPTGRLFPLLPDTPNVIKLRCFLIPAYSRSLLPLKWVSFDTWLFCEAPLDRLLPQESVASHGPRLPTPLIPAVLWWTWKSLELARREHILYMYHIERTHSIHVSMEIIGASYVLRHWFTFAVVFLFDFLILLSCESPSHLTLRDSWLTTVSYL